MKKRVKLYDIAKGIGIILVILGHISYITGDLRYFIVSFHMPLFFVISGMLMRFLKEEEKPVAVFVKNKTKRILFIYLIMSVVYLLIGNAVALMQGKFDINSLILDAYGSVVFYGISVLWFLPAMYFGVCLLYFIRKKFSHIMTVIIVCVLTVITYLLSIFLYITNIQLGVFPWFVYVYKLCVTILVSLVALFFLCIGYYLQLIIEVLLGSRLVKIINGDKIKSLIFCIAEIVLAAAVLCVVYKVAALNGVVDMHLLFFANPLLYLFCSIMGSLAIILLSAALEKFDRTILIKIIMYYGRESLTVMVTHMDLYVLYVAMTVTSYIFTYIPFKDYESTSPVVLLFVLLIEVGVIEIKRFGIQK